MTTSPDDPKGSATPSLIAGRVVDRRNQPVSEVRVFFTKGPASLPEIAALTDEHGSFILAAPSPGAYAIQCVADGFASRIVELTIHRSGEQEAVVIALDQD